jgi:hypothetical protein
MPTQGRNKTTVWVLLTIAATGMWLSVTACATEPTPPTRAQEQEIRRDSDRFFEKMKQEERTHDKGTEPAR